MKRLAVIAALAYGTAALSAAPPGQPLSDSAGLKQIQPWKVSVVSQGHIVGLVALKSVDGDVAEFTVYQGQPMKFTWSKLPASVQQAFAEDREKLVSPPEVPVEVTLRKMGARGICGRIVQKLGDGVLVRLEALDRRTPCTLYGVASAVRIQNDKLGFAGDEGDLVLVQNLPDETILKFDDTINVVGFAQGTWDYGSRKIRAFSATPQVAK